MFDVNNHPMQDALNRDISKILAHTVMKLEAVSDKYNVDGIALAKQFRACLDAMIKQSIK